MATEPASLQSLPVELMAYVANDVPPSDILSLRLVCRDVAAKTHDVFLSVHFESKCFMLSNEASLDTLFRISECVPFTRAIKHLTFLATRLIHMSEDKNVTLALDSDLASRMSRAERRAYTNTCRRTYLALLADETAFVAGTRGAFLSEILRNFKAAGCTLDISVMSMPRHPEFPYTTATREHGTLQNFINDYRPWGYRTLTKVLNTSVHSMSEYSELRPREERNLRLKDDQILVYQAVVESGIPIRALSLDNRAALLKADVVTARALSHPLTLRTLKLTMDVYAQRTALKAVVRDFVGFLSRVKNLEHLSLRTSRGDYLFGCLASVTYPDGANIEVEVDVSLLPNLKSLELCNNHHLSVDTILSFVRQRKRTLTVITLNDIFTHGKSWNARVTEGIDFVAEARRIRKVFGDDLGESWAATADISLEQVYLGPRFW